MSLSDYLKQKQKSHLIFDFDETLVKLVIPWEWEFSVGTIKDELSALDRKIYEDFKNGKISFSELQNSYIIGFGAQARDLIIKNNIQFESTHLRDILPNPELIEFVKDDKNYKLLIWSSNTRPTVERALKQFNILDKFEKIVTREDVTLIKPYLEGFEKLYDPNLAKDEYLFVGDSKFDKLAAKEAGIDFYYVDYFEVPGKYW